MIIDINIRLSALRNPFDFAVFIDIADRGKLRSSVEGEILKAVEFFSGSSVEDFTRRRE